MADRSLLSPGAEKTLNLKTHAVEPLKSSIPGNYSVTALPANHAPTMGAMLYAVQSDGSTVFYGADTATLPQATWRAFHQHEFKFDLVILDHTYGLNQPGRDHLSARQFIDHVHRMRD